MDVDKNCAARGAIAWLFAVCMTAAGCGKDEPPPVVDAEAKKAAAEGEQEADQPVLAVNSDRGNKLYLQHCAACHGERGDGAGLAARFLFPKPRDFRAGRFRLVSTVNGVPTPEDLDAVLARGMPGSAMLPFAHLSDADRAALVAEVLKFRAAGARDEELALAAAADEEISEVDLAEAAARSTTAGKVFEIPAAAVEPDLQRGRMLYLNKGCAACHGDTGRGDGQQKMVDGEGLPTRPRDLTRGIYKGSPDFVSVYRRVWLGMPGSPMPASQLITHDEAAQMVHYVLSLSTDETRNATVLSRRRITAKRTKRIPEGPDAPEWGEVEVASLGTTPLWWRDDADARLEVQAMHDGQVLAVRLSWQDVIENTDSARSESFRDAAAIEIAPGDEEPFVGMGSPSTPIDVWMWDADAAGGSLDVEQVNPNMVVDLYPLAEEHAATAESSRGAVAREGQPDLTVAALAAGNPIAPHEGRPTVQALTTIGPGTVTFQPPVNQTVKGAAVWQMGRWHVTLTRALAAEGDQSVNLAPGARVSAAFAIFDGAFAERGGQKRITPWHDLVLEP